MRIRKADFGRRCTVQYDDVGRQDAMLLGEAMLKDDYQVFLFAGRYTDAVDKSQIVELGDFLVPRPPL